MKPDIGLLVFIFFCVIICCVGSVRGGMAKIPKEFSDFIARPSPPIEYKELSTHYGGERLSVPAAITKAQATEDIQIIEYLLNTSYSGLEYWEHNGVDFKAYFSHLRDFVSGRDTVCTDDFETEVSGILKQINDGHIAIIGAKYNWAYRHKSVYFCDVLVEKTDSGAFEVIDSKLDTVRIGDQFTQKDGEKYLFKTLAPPNRSHYLVGTLSYDAAAPKRLSFNNEMIRIPFHKSRMMYARPLDSGPVHVERDDNTPIIRVSSFADEQYANMKRFMDLGHELRSEKRIILDLSYNGGGSSVFPQTFIQKLNGLSEWEITWAILSSPAITQYFAKHDPSAMPDIAPSFRQVILSNRERHEEHRKRPARSWEFGETRRKEPDGDYDGTLIILANRRVLSAAEAMIGYSRSLRNRIVIGENTAGVAQFSDVQQYLLPNSKLIIKLPRQILLIPDFEECIGFLPDYWLDSMEPMKEVLRWLKSPDDYQFRFFKQL